MSGWTIRARLTAAIVVLTAVLSLLGLWLGVGVLEGQVRDAAIEARVEQFDGFDNDGFDAFTKEVFASPDFIDVFDLTGVIFGTEFEEFDKFETAFVTETVNDLAVYDELAAAYGSSSGTVQVWLSPESIVAIDRDGSAAMVSEPLDVPVVPLVDLLELNPIDVEELLQGGSPDDLELAFGTEEMDGVTFGFVAEVTDELDAVETIRSTLQVVLAAIVVGAGLATWFIAGRALRPVGQITGRVREITAGSLDDRVPESGREDEIGVLARTMNTMLGRLENADLRRRQFVSDASHELRTPVAVLKSEAEVARRAPDSTSVDELATVVLAESNRLQGLVGDLLSLARSDESSVGDARGMIDLDEVVFAEASRTRAVPVDQGEVSAGRIAGTTELTQRIVAHLLDNACRHAESRVAIGVRTDGEQVRLWVDDDGPGISADQRERIFERFIRLDDARSRDEGGAGLGLAVVAASVEELAGTIAVTEAPLGGARFELTFPRA